MPDTGLILGLLAVVAVMAAIGRRTGLAGPIVFALGGIGLALVPGVPSIVRPPSLVLVVFLPRVTKRARGARRRCAECEPTTPVLVVVSWAGMRGVISLAVALSLPQVTAGGRPFPGRDLIIFVTFA